MLKRRDERDLRIPAFGVHLRQSVSAEELISKLRAEGWPVYVIEGAPDSKAEFHEAVRAALPQDPPLGPTPNWDALLDSVWGGIGTLGEERVAVIWPDSTRLAEGDPDTYRVAKEILTDIVFGLADPKFSAGETTRLLVLLG
jgi:hypothetical protein